MKLDRLNRITVQDSNCRTASLAGVDLRPEAFFGPRSMPQPNEKNTEK